MINYDIVMPHYGFVIHPHRNIKIIIYVTKGLLHIETHMETMAKLHLVILSNVVGKRIFHSEYNLENEVLLFYQIWI
ncbi:MAG: pirin family protein [Francisella endosymbiont of Hyalomma scupense]